MVEGVEKELRKLSKNFNFWHVLDDYELILFKFDLLINSTFYILIWV